MIPRASKFPLRTDFKVLISRSTQQTTERLRILTLPHTPSRLAVIVPKKLSKLASTRNWLKRLTYKLIWPTVQDKKLDVVIVYKPLHLHKSLLAQEQITHELHKALTAL